MSEIDLDALRDEALARKEERIARAKKAIREARNDFRKAMESLTEVERLSQRETTRGQRGWLAEQIRAVARELPDPFESSHVLTAIVAANPDKADKVSKATLSSALSRLDGDFLECVQQGAGRRASKYRVKGGETSDPIIEEAA